MVLVVYSPPEKKSKRNKTGNLNLSSFNKNRREETTLASLKISHTNVTHSYIMENETKFNAPMCSRCNANINVKYI